MAKLTDLPTVNQLQSFWFPEKAYQKAGDQLEQYYGQAREDLGPYAQQGQQAFEPLFGAMQNLMDPQGFEGQMLEGYEASPHARMLQEEASQQGLNAASSMGMLGSTPALQAMQRGTTGIVQGDRDNYLNRMMGSYLSGSNIAQNMYGQGQQAAGGLAQMAMNQGDSMADVAYGKQSAPGELFGKMAGMLAGVGGVGL